MILHEFIGKVCRLCGEKYADTCHIDAPVGCRGTTASAMRLIEQRDEARALVRRLRAPEGLTNGDVNEAIRRWDEEDGDT